MRILNMKEVQQVSGAGEIADRARAIGESIGSIVDAARHRNNDIGKQHGGQLGQAIGGVIEAHISIAESWGHGRRPKN